MKANLVMALVILSTTAAQEDALEKLFRDGNEAFDDSSWSEAINSYETILANGFNHTDLYYNLGNAYYRFGSMGQSIWAYEKGLQLDQGDDDLRHNLTFTKREAGIAELPQPFFLLRIYNSVKSALEPHQWLLISGVAFLVSGTLFALSHLGSAGTAQVTKAPFVVMIGLIIVSGLIFLDVRQDAATLSDAIVVAHVGVGAKSAPHPGAKTLFHLPEGTKVKIVSEQKEWHEVESIDGSKGWVQSADVRSLSW